ncbi:hypothetical protein NLU13_0909 [Sarocladium strictum]|uniref:Uncharacterized protein n=1 Tax=Sarocladium strictum TaxID=5046 RepID=A0AA39GQP7_SARSR|nr:hypothetical protein NLU13_0909 [Sarocladium strictum]
MATLTTLPALLESLTQSLSSAHEMTPKLTNIGPPKDGLSLLDVKNELLLSYLQNLVFLILLKIRNAKKGADADATGEEDDDDLFETVREKLVELRLFLEKGARPLEAKLQYSITQFLKATEHHQQQEKLAASKRKEASDDEDEDDDDDDEESEEEGTSRRRGRVTAAPGLKNLQEDVKAAREKDSRGADGKTGVYQPPKRERKLMDAPNPDERRRDRRGGKSATMDEYVATELSAAPLAEPSIGTTIVQGGRRMKSASERKDEDERREYEETNFVRLPAMSKKEKKQKAKREGRSDKMEFGGEEWRGLGEGVDRIDRLTRRRDGGKGGGVRALLDKSRKRGPETTDGPRGSGMEMGERFHKRAKMLETGRRR